jgi:Parvulin-like peptidyl-prolyl isomerase
MADKVVKKKAKMNSDMKGFIVFAVIVVIGLALLFYNMTKPKVFVTIDGNKVNAVEFQYYYSQNLSQALQQKDSSMDEQTFLSQNTGSGTVKDSIKQQTISQIVQVRVLLLKAKKDRFKFDGKEINDAWQSFKSNLQANAQSNQMDLQKFAKAAFNVSLGNVEKYYKDYVKAQKYMEAKTEEVSVNKDDLAKYYNDNKKNLDKAVVRHILIMCDQSASESVVAEKKKQAEDILAKVNNGGDFAALAKQYSEDTGSKDDGGKYEIKQDGQMVAEFQDWAFSHKTGDTGIVRTQFGFHVMKLDNIYDTLESQAKDIETAYKSNKYQTSLQEELQGSKYKIEVKDAYSAF